MPQRKLADRIKSTFGEDRPFTRVEHETLAWICAPQQYLSDQVLAVHAIDAASTSPDQRLIGERQIIEAKRVSDLTLLILPLAFKVVRRDR